MIYDSKCKDCGALLPEGNGFSDLCEKCSPVEELEIVGGTEALRAVSAPFRGDNTLALPLRHSRRVIHAQVKEKEADFDLGISLEMSTAADLEAYKSEIDNELLTVRTKIDDLKIKKARKIWSDPSLFMRLEKERKVLGRKHQILAEALASKRKKEKAAKQPAIDAENTIRHSVFHDHFFVVAQRLLEENVFKMLCAQARIEAGQ